MKRLNITDKFNCTGCGACLNSCPCDAISMQPDEEGFPYPVIVDESCIDCGQCVAVCPLIAPYLQPYGTPLEDATVYAAWSRDKERRINSTSGGIFSELAEHIFRQGGSVAGAVYGEQFAIHHVLTDNPNDLTALRQSKYAQSDIRLIFREIDVCLKKGQPVLFCGAPCQSAGLRAVLGRDYPNLLLCDFICRGINSPKAYQSYLDMLKGQHGVPALNIQFKNKDFGWNRFHTKVTFANGSTHCQDRYTDPFMVAYLKYNLMIRPSCHACQFKGKGRNVDLTLGDFWGIGRTMPDLDSDKGTSVVIASSPKGLAVMESIKDSIVCETMTLENVKTGNRHLVEVVQPGKNREQFFAHLDEWPFEKLMRRYASPSWSENCRLFLRRWKGYLRRILCVLGIEKKAL